MKSSRFKVTLLHHAVPEAEVMFQDVGNEAVLLSLAAERYFGLDVIGARVWRLLGTDSSLQAAFDTLLCEYEVEPDRLERELLGLVEDLSDAGLVRIR